MARGVDSQIPRGSLQEVVEAGMDPMLVSICHNDPTLRRSGYRQCPVEASCQFNLKSRGGFKGVGPKNVGYYLRTGRTEGAKEKEDFCPCYAFVATMQARMIAGMDAKNKGQDYEHIEIIAQEGEEIVVQKFTSEVPGSSTNIRIKRETLTLKVPAFPRPGENPQATHSQKLAARRKAREAQSVDYVETRAEQLARRKREMAADDGDATSANGGAVAVEVGGGDAAADLPPPSGGPKPVAQPVAKKA